MAAHDPEQRRAAAVTAARARVDALAPEERRQMTAPARAELRRRDLAAVDDEARRLGTYPLDDGTRAFRADVLAAVRAKRASDAARAAARRDAPPPASVESRLNTANHEGGDAA